MASNSPLDISAINYDSIVPRPPTYEQLLHRDPTPRGQNHVVFTWNPEAFKTAPRDRAVACIHLEDIATAREQITTYQALGLSAERIVVAGKVSNLPDDAYDELTAMGVLLEEADWERYGNAAQARLERALTPFYRTLLQLGPTFENVTSRPYTYEPSPTPVRDEELRRIGDLLRGDQDMFD